jgi:hypothetical protein
LLVWFLTAIRIFASGRAVKVLRGRVNAVLKDAVSMFRLSCKTSLASRTTLRIWCALLGLATLSGCSWLVSTSAQQCTVDDDCTARGSAFAGSTCIDNLCVLPPTPDAATEIPTPTGWECIGNPTPSGAVKPQVQLTVRVGDLIHPEVSVSDAVVLRACHKLDVTCAMPIGDAIHPDATGHASFTITTGGTGFDGYIEVNPAVKPPVYVPTMIFISPPIVDDYVYQLTALLSIADLPALVQQTGSAAMNPALGALIYRAADCNRVPAAGISGMLDLPDPTTKAFFVINGLPTTNINETDASGLGGFINVPRGVRSVMGTRLMDNLYIGTVLALVRPSTFTYMTLAPDP